MSGKTISLPQAPPPGRRASAPDGTRPYRVALVGNPNAGKTTLFNALTGLRAKTSNYAGTTVERRQGRLTLGGGPVTIIDLPGLYALDAATPEERVARDVLMGRRDADPMPDAVVLVLDATNLDRNLFLASQALPLGLPAVVALTMTDSARRAGIELDLAKLSDELGCPVVPVNAPRGEGVTALKTAIEGLTAAPHAPKMSEELAGCTTCSGCPFSARYDWAERVGSGCASSPGEAAGQMTERLDRILTHRRTGVLLFAAVMLFVFWLIFSIAQYPMGWIELLFETVGGVTDAVLPAGTPGSLMEDVHSLLVDGVIGGVGGMLVFLPQIAILFFFIALLEDSGYMARAAFVMDRLMHRVGLPGKSFVPLLSAHACALPAIMATRTIENRRDRLTTILVAPLMTCSARVPVYALLVALLFADRPGWAAVTFAGAYALGIVAALAMAMIFKRTILKGDTEPTVIELPHYRWPSLKNALLLTLDRCLMFVKKAGTVILLLSVLLWAAATYPKTDAPAEAVALEAQAVQVEAAGDADAAAALVDEAERLTARNALDYSVAGRIGNFIEPVFAPLGFDERISIGVFTSFAAREVIVSTLAVLYNVGEDGAEDTTTMREVLLGAQRDDGTPVFTTATCLSLLVFYVLAMQCLPTQAVTKRETGSWGWAAFQLGYMTVLAYSAALVTYQVAVLFT